MAKKDRRTRAELLETLRRLDRACDARERELEVSVKLLRDDKAHLTEALDNSRIAIGTFDAENRRLKKQLETIEAEHRRKSEIRRSHTEGYMEGQREAFLSTIELLLAGTTGVSGTDFRELI